MKKEHINYFEEFKKVTEIIVASAKIVEETLANYSSENVVEKGAKLHALENSSDRIVHHIRSELIKDFLPPIEREDIATLSHKLDDVEDHIDEILINMRIMNISTLNEDLVEFMEILTECCNQLKEIFENLQHIENSNNHKLILDEVIVINHIEERGDRCFEKQMTNLYKNHKDPVEIIKWSNICNCFESAIDSCEVVGDLISDIVLKNS